MSDPQSANSRAEQQNHMFYGKEKSSWEEQPESMINF